MADPDKQDSKQLAEDNSAAAAALIAANKLENDKKKAELQKKVSSTLDTLRRSSDVTRYSLYGIEFNPAFAAFIGYIGTGLNIAAETTLNISKIIGNILLDAIPITRAIVRGSLGMWRLVTKDNPTDGIYTRAIKVVVDLLVIATAILGCCFPPLAITITLTSIIASTVRDMWIFGAAMISRKSGSWRKEINEHEADKTNFYNYLSHLPTLSYMEEGQQKTLSSIQLLTKIRQGNDPIVKLIDATVVEKITTWDKKLTNDSRRLAERDIELGRKLHNVFFGVTALIGAVLLFTPAAPVGALILVATSIYGLMHKYDFPFGWASKISKKVFGEPKPIPLDTINREVSLRQHQPRPHNTEADILKKIHTDTPSPSPRSSPSVDDSDTCSLLTEPTPITVHSLPNPKPLMNKKNEEDESDGESMRKKHGRSQSF